VDGPGLKKERRKGNISWISHQQCLSHERGYFAKENVSKNTELNMDISNACMDI
jgi:hypothetical protein